MLTVVVVAVGAVVKVVAAVVDVGVPFTVVTVCDGALSIVTVTGVSSARMVCTVVSKLVVVVVSTSTVVVRV